jgi:CubicO group peptidase (beta-lactamase class C family)
VAVVARGQDPWLNSAGLADLRERRPASPATACCWFSMTKIVTATAAMQLAEGGRLGLDDPITRYVPAFPARRHGKVATVRHLLSHSAGLSNPLPVRWVHPPHEDGPEPDELLARLPRRHRRLKRAPGTRAHYSNVGFLLLGEVIAAASGRPYRDYVREQVLAPLGMTRTDFGYAPGVARDVATGYHWRRSPAAAALELLLPRWVLGPRVGQYRELRPFVNDGAAYGGLIGPVEDAARFVAAHVGGGTLNGVEVLRRESVAAMQTPTASGRVLDVGLGWFRRRSDTPSPERYWEHLGGGAGFWTMIRVFPDRGLGAVTMGNATAYDHQRLAAVLQGHRPGVVAQRHPDAAV